MHHIDGILQRESLLYESDYGAAVREGICGCSLSVYLPKRNVDRTALVVELKWKKSARGAIARIKDRQYVSWIQGYTGNILLVEIDYDEKKGHECLTEEYRRE